MHSSSWITKLSCWILSQVSHCPQSCPWGWCIAPWTDVPPRSIFVAYAKSLLLYQASSLKGCSNKILCAIRAQRHYHIKIPQCRANTQIFFPSVLLWGCCYVLTAATRHRHVTPSTFQPIRSWVVDTCASLLILQLLLHSTTVPLKVLPSHFHVLQLLLRIRHVLVGIATLPVRECQA